MDRGKIVIAINTAWNIVNFRSGLVRALIAEGYEVIAVAPDDPVSRATLEAMGCRFHAVPMDSKGTSVRRDFAIYRAMRALFRAERPIVMLGYTIKPNVYGSLAARASGVPTINNISGLGTGFMRAGLLNCIVRGLYRIGLARAQTVFFQNADDRDVFTRLRLVRRERTALLPGSGIDLARFVPGTPPAGDGGPLFLLVARMLWDKGVGEFIAAARIVRRERPAARFRLLGFLDVDNRTAIPRATVEGWVSEGLIDYQPPVDDVRPMMTAADVVVLPSYREGTSRVLLEAAALGRPIVATDVPGCREVIDEGRSGYLCAVKDAPSLARAMIRMCDLSAAERIAMGAAGRRKVEREFDERIVIEAYLQRIAALPPAPTPNDDQRSRHSTHKPSSKK